MDMNKPTGCNDNQESTPLTAVNAGQKVSLVAVEAGRKLKSYLMSMGLIKGREIRVISNASQGPLLISFGDSRITLGRGAAAKVIVALPDHSYGS
jgi:Fe2+ transport system protein FeoA